MMSRKVDNKVHYDLDFTLIASSDTFDGTTSINFYYRDVPEDLDLFLLSYSGEITSLSLNEISLNQQEIYGQKIHQGRLLHLQKIPDGLKKDA